MKPPPCVLDRWAGGSLTRRPKRPFDVSRPRQSRERNLINTYNYSALQKHVFLKKHRNPGKMTLPVSGDVQALRDALKVTEGRV